MTEPMAAATNCEHHYESRILGGHPLHVRACYFCRQPDWDDLREQADELYRWGWEEGRAGKAPREALSAYDKPREAPGGELLGRNGDSGPQAASDGSALMRAHVALAAQASRDQAALARVQALIEEHPVAVDTALLEEALDQTGHDTGPTVREAAADDRRHWTEHRWGT